MRLKKVIVLPSFLLALACGGLGSNYQTQATDQAAALTVADVAPFSLLGEQADRTKESWELSKGIDGVWSMEYNYSGETLVLSSQLQLDSSTSGAETTYGALGLGMSVGMLGQKGVELVPAPAIPYGDESDCQYFHSSNVDVGFVCRIREGKRTALYMAVGFLPNGEATPEALLRRPWEAFQGWDPSVNAKEIE